MQGSSGQQESKALVIVDVQNDFCEGGSLPVPDAGQIIPIINNIRNNFEVVIFTQDYHNKKHISFAENHPGSSLFQEVTLKTGVKQILWPSHCVEGTKGCEFHPSLVRTESDIIIRKGTNIDWDSYSGFGHKEEDTGLCSKLKELKIDSVYVCGLAWEHCVGSTALDAINSGFNKCYFLTDATKGINIETMEKMSERLRQAGVVLIASSDIF